MFKFHDQGGSASVKEEHMGKNKNGSKPILEMVLSLLIMCFAGSSLADNGKSLLKQAKIIFGPLPQVMSSDKNPITPEKVKLGQTTLTGLPAWIITIAALGVSFLWKVNATWLILGGATIGWILSVLGYV